METGLERKVGADILSIRQWKLLRDFKQEFTLALIGAGRNSGKCSMFDLILVPSSLKKKRVRGTLSSKYSRLHFFPGISSHFSLKHEDEDKKMKEKEPCKLEPRKTEKDLCSDYVSKVSVF